MDVSAAEVYLVHQWHKHTGTPDERRVAIFREFVALGQKGRWPWLRLANNFEYSAEEKKLIDSCREPEEQSMMDWIGQTTDRLIFVKAGQLDLTQQELDWATAMWDDAFICEGERYADGNPFDFMPELVYSMTAADDPDDVAEARSKEPDDQSLVVTGVYWLYDGQLKLTWCDEYGKTIRQAQVDRSELKDVHDTFRAYNHFESKFWLEATRFGDYASLN